MTKIGARTLNSTRIRRAILDGAAKVFLNEGYTASIERIAAEAGVARKTVFNMFESKDKLFAAVLSEAIVHSVDLRALESNGDVEGVLRDFAKCYMEIALSDEAILLGRLVNAEFQRFPELIGRLSKSFTTQMIPPLSRYFSRLIKARRIVKVDPDMAAERFLASILGYERVRLGLGGNSKSPAWRHQYLEEAVRGFVRGIGMAP